jgi:hypothetical protein
MNDLKEFYEGTDEDVRRELEDAGIDVEACRKSFKEAIENAKAKRFLRILFWVSVLALVFWAVLSLALAFSLSVSSWGPVSFSGAQASLTVSFAHLSFIVK